MKSLMTSVTSTSTARPNLYESGSIKKKIKILPLGCDGPFHKDLDKSLGTRHGAGLTGIPALGDCMFGAVMTGYGLITHKDGILAKNVRHKRYEDMKEKIAGFRQRALGHLRSWSDRKWLTTVPWTHERQQLLLEYDEERKPSKQIHEEMIAIPFKHTDSAGFYVLADMLQIRIIEVWGLLSAQNSFHPRLYGDPSHNCIILVFNGRNHWETVMVGPKFQTLFDPADDIVQRFLQLPRWIETSPDEDSEKQLFREKTGEEI
jgi:hypothetical protein